MVTKTKTEIGLEENLEALLAYVLGWITGIIFLIIEKKSKFVKFHAIQSIIVFGFFTVISIIVSVIFGLIPIFGWIIGGLIEAILWIIAIIVWIISMIKAYRYEWFEWPIAGEIAKKNI